MKWVQRIGLLFLVLAGAYACVPEEEVLLDRPIELQFSTDTVFFDTLFTEERSISKRLRVYNPSDKAVLLETIALAGGASSPYTLFVNGQPGTSFGTQRLLGRDSLLLLLELRLPPTTDPDPYLAQDAVVVVNQGLHQEIPLLAWGQNARRLSESVLACNTQWDSGLPYIIENSILVDTLCSLTLAKGTRLYFKPGAFLYVKGSLIAEGDTTQGGGILFRNHRLGSAYEHQPGQWGGIIFLEGSKNNRLRHCDIRNAQVGVRLGTPDADSEPDLVLESCRLLNHLEAGILAYTSDLSATNTLVANCVGPAVANLAGGNYSYRHCTFANFYTGPGQRDLPAGLFADNILLDNGELLVADLSLRLQNCIIWGNLGSANELILDQSGGGTISLQVENNLIRTKDTSLAQGGNLISTEQEFVKFSDRSQYNFRPDTLSPAIDAARPLGIPLDLSGKERDSKPDIGALEYFYVPPTEGE